MKYMDILDCTTRERTIVYLIQNDYFDIDSIGTPDMEFYINDCINNVPDSIYCIDRHAHLNTLFGYDIGYDNAQKIDDWIYHNENLDWDDAMEVGFKDKNLIEQCVNELGLDLSFDKWKTEDFNCYEYY